jgi:aconitase (EC 4.2.1.3)
MTFDIDMIKKVYERYPERIAKAREVVGKPLTLAEKNYFTRTFGKAMRHKLMKEEILM